MLPLLIKTLTLSLLVVGASTCNGEKEKVITKWSGGEKKVTYKIYAGDETRLTNIYYCAYYPNGRVWKTGYIKSDKESGEWFSYYQSGKMKSKWDFIEGRPSGIFEIYYESGELEQKGTVDAFKREFVTKMYNRDGTKKDSIEDLTKYYKEQPVKWTKKQKREIWIDCYVAVASAYPEPEQFCNCAVAKFQQHYNYSDIQSMTEKQKGDLMESFEAKKMGCYYLFRKVKAAN
jgi:hypothetical protein